MLKNAEFGIRNYSGILNVISKELKLILALEWHLGSANSIPNSEFRIPNSEFRIPNSELKNACAIGFHHSIVLWYEIGIKDWMP